MVQPTQARHGIDGCVLCWLLLHRPSIRRVLSQGIVNTVLMVIGYVITQYPAEMFFVEWDHMIEDFTATRSHPSLGNSVLPRRLHARLLDFQTRRLQKGDHIGVVSRIAIEDCVTIPTSLGEGFTQLLHHPLGCRVSRHIEVQDLPASMLDDEEAMQQSERHRWYGEEVERNDHLAMILQEGQPALAGIPAEVDSPQVSSHGSLGDDETQFQEFSVNLGCTPSGILFRHLADQGANLLGDLRPATARSRMPAPVETETSPMPADDGFGFDNLEDIHPAGPATRQGSPEEPVQGVERRPRSLALQHCQLLPQGEDFERDVGAILEEDPHSAEDGEDEFGHELMVVTWRNVASAR